MLKRQITLSVALEHMNNGFYTSYDSDKHELININEKCGRCSKEFETRNRYLAPIYCEECNGGEYENY